MRIQFLTQLFDPEPAFVELAFASDLRRPSHEVEVVTGFPNHTGTFILVTGYAPEHTNKSMR